jgi:hypothetical protein
MERYRILPESAVYFVTYSIVDWLPRFRLRVCLQDRDRNDLPSAKIGSSRWMLVLSPRPLDEQVTESLRICHICSRQDVTAFTARQTNAAGILPSADPDAGCEWFGTKPMNLSRASCVRQPCIVLP